MSFLSQFLSTKTLAFGGFTLGLLALKRYFSGGVSAYNSQNTKLNGKIVVITGSNTGIGKETVAEIAKCGAKVILACKSKERAQQAMDSIRTADAKADLEFMELDLSDLESVHRFVTAFKVKYSKLHILINNAGIMGTPYQKTKQGFELQFGTNHLGHFYLTNLLLDTLKASAPARVVMVASRAHRLGHIDFDDLFFESKRKYDGWSAYGQSKLANLLFANELNHRYSQYGVTATSLHPGVVMTEITRNLLSGYKSYLAYAFYPLLFLAFKSPWYGAQTTIHCALAPDAESTGAGKYYSDCVATKPLIAEAEDAAVAKKLWDVSAKLVGL